MPPVVSRGLTPTVVALPDRSLPTLVTLPAMGTPPPGARPQVGFSHDGHKLVGCCSRGEGIAGWTAFVWDLQRGELTAELRHDDETMPGVAPLVSWSGRERFVATVQSQDVALWAMPPGRAPPWKAPASYGYLAVSEDGSRAIWGRSDERIALVDIDSKRRLQFNHTDGFATGLQVDLDWAPGDGHALVDGAIWSRSGKVIADLADSLGDRWPNDAPLDWGWGKGALFVAAHGKLSAFDVDTGRMRWQLPNAHPPVDVHPSGDTVACIDGEGAIIVSDAALGQARAKFAGAAVTPRADSRYYGDAMRFSPDGKHLVVQRSLERGRFCDVARHTCETLPVVTPQNEPAPRWRDDVVYLRSEHHVVAWSAEPTKRWQLPAPVDRAGFDVSPDGRHVAVAAADTLHVVRLRDRRVVRLTATAQQSRLVGEVDPRDADLLAE